MSPSGVKSDTILHTGAEEAPAVPAAEEGADGVFEGAGEGKHIPTFFDLPHSPHSLHISTFLAHGLPFLKFL